MIVLRDERNKHAKANTVLVVPLATTLTEGVPTLVLLLPGETGLAEKSIVRAEDVTVIRKENLQPPREKLRTLSHSRICEIADKIACGCDPKWRSLPDQPAAVGNLGAGASNQLQ